MSSHPNSALKQKRVLMAGSVACARAKRQVNFVAVGDVGPQDFLFTCFEKLGTFEVRPMARILVIDDEPDMRLLLEQILKAAGHEVILTADGKEGVERYCASPADLVITDLYMPNQEGFETIRALHTRFPEAAIIAMSGKDTAMTMLSLAQKAGAVGILHKPFLTEELIDAVAKGLRGKAPAR